jgi:hypothetical protein
MISNPHDEFLEIFVNTNFRKRFFEENICLTQPFIKVTDFMKKVYYFVPSGSVPTILKTQSRYPEHRV